MARPNALAGAELDRAHLLRRDARWQAERLADPDSRALAVAGTRVPVIDDGAGVQAAFSPVAAIAPLAQAESAPVFLGVDAGRALFAVDVSLAPEARLDQALAPARLDGLREVGGLVSQRDGGLLAYAAGLLAWHARHGFCGVCGAATQAAEAGHLRVCTNTEGSHKHFPRTDPVVIMLVCDGDRCLLGRQAVWPPGRYSALAGYVEPGESLEEAVAREVAEEAGVQVSGVTYHSSQPWPFPSSLMLGFTASLTGAPDLRLADEELEDVRWFGCDELMAAVETGHVLLPPPVAIARRLIEDWLAETARR